jgi:hypothetical protein
MKMNEQPLGEQRPGLSNQMREVIVSHSSWQHDIRLQLDSNIYINITLQHLSYFGTVMISLLVATSSA